MPVTKVLWQGLEAGIVTGKKRKMSEMQVQYITHSGSDLLVVNAARVSFAKESKRFNDKDQKLITYLAEYKHWLPFRHPQVTLRCKAPMFVARQLGKHHVS